MSTANKAGGFISELCKANLKPTSPAYAEASAWQARPSSLSIRKDDLARKEEVKITSLFYVICHTKI
jgi:hypothetical protein